MFEQVAVPTNGTAMSKKEQDDGAKILWRNIHAPEKTPVDGDEIEDCLWMYAGQLLSEKEESDVARLIACHPEVEDRIDQIRATIDQVPESSWLVKVACARAAAKRLATTAGLKLSQINGFVARIGRGLFPVFPTPELRIAQPIMLGGERGKDDSAAPLGRRVDLPEEKGLQISLIYTPDGAVDLVISANSEPVQGVIRLEVESAKANQGWRPFRTWMRNGRARIEDCPSGLLQLKAPGDRIQRFCLYDLEQLQSDEEELPDV